MLASSKHKYSKTLAFPDTYYELIINVLQSVELFCAYLYIVASILLIIFSPIDSINKRLDDDDKMFCKKITIVIVLVIFVITEILWCMGYRYYTRFIVVGVILAELLQLVTIFRNMVENESYRKI